MFGVNLINAGFLAAAVAVSVPILIHLLMRPRARPVSIGTLRFLKLALKETTRRRKVRRWLLLALRMAAVLLLALLFARPYLTSASAPGKDREVIVLVDQSGSMAAMNSGRSLFSLAQTAAAKILKELPEGTNAHLAYFDNRGASPCEDARVDSNRQPGYAGTDFGQALCWARDVLVTSNRQDRKVYLLTDLQRTGQHCPCNGFPADAEIEIVELGNPLTSNLAIEKVEVSQPTIRNQEPIGVRASVSNSGLMHAHNLQVRLHLESTGVHPADQTKTVSIAPAASAQVDFSVPLETQGLYQGYVEVAADDGFEIDNRRHVAFEARTADRILLVDGEPGSSVFASETYYLDTALRLALPGKSSALTTFAPERMTLEGGTHLPELGTYRMVALCNVARLSANDLSQLRAFVNWGGRLLIFTGGKCLPAGYAPFAQAGLMPCTVEGASEAGLFRLQSWNKEHPIFRPFDDPQQGDLHRVSFRKITRVKAAADAKILAADVKGNPLLLEKNVGRGKVLLCASAADRDWGDWPQSRLYVPIMHQIFGYLTERLPENQRIRVEIAGPGIDHPPGVVHDKTAVVVRNIDARESHIERYSQAQFREEFQLAGVKMAEDPRQTLAAMLPAGAQRPSEIWTTVIWFLLIVLALETFIANRTHA